MQDSTRPAGSRDDGTAKTDPQPLRAPAITLPKGAGALPGIDGKFSVNAVNGTCDLGVQLPFSSSRSDFGPTLALRYSSGNGNGPFGLGWALDLPAIQRRTDKELPRYEDARDSDVFQISGAEDLVPFYRDVSPGNWQRDSTSAAGVTRDRYRPRIEGLFARIERISIQGETAPFWKVTTRDNVTTFYGRTAAARIADPVDGARVFKWLPEWSFDDKGNCTQFVYKSEDLADVPNLVDERGRLAGIAPFANTYLKRVKYGNRQPYFLAAAHQLDAQPPAGLDYFFETVVDYGEHGADSPAETRSWRYRYDPFSDCHASFDLRTNRLASRILFFSSFAELNQPPGGPPAPCLVRSLDLSYRHFAFDASPYRSEEAELLTSIRSVFYERAGAGYASRALPPFDLEYQPLAWNTTVRDVLPEDVMNAPTGAGRGYQLTDLDAEGIPGLLTEQADGWYYKHNLGNGHFARAESVMPKPSLTGLSSGTLQLQDLDADGAKQIVVSAPGVSGYFARSDDGEWQPFRAFEQAPQIDFADPNLRFVDLNGDGRSDLLITEDLVFTWYPSLGTRGYDPPSRASRDTDEDRGPVLVFADGTQTVFLADMNGDGLTDLVRVRNGNVCYWPNLGYGRFGAKVTMRDSPTFDDATHFDPAYIRFFDISGTGAADLFYLGRNRCTAWTNLAGNAWSASRDIGALPGTQAANRVVVADLLGNGTACVVWSSELPAHAGAPLRYIDLMGGAKPYLLAAYHNNLGLHVRLEYTSSSYFYLRDKAAGRPWATKLPFPTMCLRRRETRDSVSALRFVETYTYRHGYFDHVEREFRGFAMVERIDIEDFDRFAPGAGGAAVDASVHQAPVREQTWFHTGAFVGAETLVRRLEGDFFVNPVLPEQRLPEPAVEGGPLTAEERRQAARACKGTAIRRELFADDGSPDETKPFETGEHTRLVRMLQPQLGNRHAVFIVHEAEAVTRHYERSLADPRVAHSLTTAVDELGNVRESASVVYGRVAADATLPADVQAEQARVRIVYHVTDVTNDVVTATAYRLRRVSETRTYELTGVPPAGGQFTRDEIQTAFQGAALLDYQTPPHANVAEKRLVQHRRTLYAQDANPNTPLSLGTLNALGLHYEDYVLALTPGVLASLYGGRVTEPMLVEGQYGKSDDYKTANLFPPSDPAGCWWVRSGFVNYPANPEQHFYLADRYIDAAGATTRVRYFSNYHLLIDRTEDALGNRTTVNEFDFRFLLPRRTTDINDNVTEVMLDMRGMVVGVAVRGKGAEADDFAGFSPDLTDAEVSAFLLDPVGQGPGLLQHATSRYVYSFAALPVVSATISRETHHQASVTAGVPSPLQYGFEYTSGTGRVAMKKIQAEPGIAKRCDVHPDGTYTIVDVDTTPNRRWIGSGRTVWNNKGSAVMQYEPYFSDTHRYEPVMALIPIGVTPVLFYDPLGRLVRTALPDGTLTRVEFGPWHHRTFDRNDTVLESDWYVRRIGGGLGAAEQRAADKTALHASTPVVVHLDTLGRSIYSVAHNKSRDRVSGLIVEQFYATRTTIDIEGNTLLIRDPRGNAVMEYAYDIAGGGAYTRSMDRGERWLLKDALGKALYGFDATGSRFHTVYDQVHRPTRHEVLLPGNVVPVVYERSEYGVNAAANENGQVVGQFDSAGVVRQAQFDFHGNVGRTTRQFAVPPVAPATTIDWTTVGTVALEPTVFQTENEYDALSRVTRSVTADASERLVHYNESNLLSGVDMSVRGAAVQSFVTRVEHNEKGQRRGVEHGNGVSSTFEYDPLTFKIRVVRTTRASDGAALQDLRYTYDPVGNITEIRDLAQQTIYFNNQIVLPDATFTYDAVYRLVNATGREHIGQNRVVDPYDELRINLPHKADGNAMQNYRQEYEYDAAGNLTAMVHAAGLGSFVHRWTRVFHSSATDNRLPSTEVGALTENYTYDAHGNMTSAPHLAALDWDFDNHLVHVNLSGGGTASYTYDADGNRVRKTVERTGGIVEQRLYVGAVEFFERTEPGVAPLRRETLHVMDGAHRLAMIDTRTAGAGPGPAQLERYQYPNNLGTAALELDDSAAVISYEEYYPFGSTSFQSVDGSREVPERRYRYTGKERDEESGFYYHGARYYAPWLARWTAPDPAGVADGNNLYAYCQNHPIASSDPTGMWEMPSWRTIAIVAAVVVVSVAVTVVTAGVAGPVIAGAAATAFGSGTVAATVATGVAVGAVAGAAGGAAGELTRQVASGESVSGGRIARAAVSGAIGGAVTGGIGSAVGSVAQGAGAAGRAARTASVAARSAAVPRTAGQVASRVAQGAAMGAVGSATGELGAQALVDRQFDAGRLGWATVTGAGVGAGVATVSPTFTPILGGGATRTGVRLADAAFGRGSVGSTAGALYAAERGISLAPSRGQVPSNAVNVDTGSAVSLASEGTNPVPPTRAGVLPATNRADVEAIVAGRPTVMSRTAVTEFQTNVRAAGPGERARVFDFLSQTRIIPDAPDPTISGLPTSRSIGVTDKIIFGTGQSRGIPTLTTDNVGSAAAAQGVTITPPPIVHVAIPFSGL